jgi:hypothetical protein
MSTQEPIPLLHSIQFRLVAFPFEFSRVNAERTYLKPSVTVLRMTQKTVQAMLAVFEDEAIPVFRVFVLEIMKVFLGAISTVEPLIHVRPHLS